MAYSLAVPGVTIIVMPGVYRTIQRLGASPQPSGTASSPIVLRSQIRGGAVIDGQNASDRNEGIYLDGGSLVMSTIEIMKAIATRDAAWGHPLIFKSATSILVLPSR